MTKTERLFVLHIILISCLSSNREEASSGAKSRDIAYIVLEWVLVKLIKLTLNCLHILEVMFEATASYNKTSSGFGHISDGVNLFGDLTTL